VLDSLRHLMDAQAPNSRFRIGKGELLQREPAQGQPQEEAGSTPSKDSINDVDGGAGAHSAAASRSAAGASAAAAAPTSSSIALNFAHVVWLFTTNIGSQQVQKVAYDAAKAGLPRESLSPHHLHDMLLASLDHTSQLALLRDSSVLSALIPFFPLFKAHVKECARVQLEHRKKYWLQNAQVSAFDWDASVPAYAASQLKYSGPISVYGCKNVHEILTTTLLAPLTRQFRKEQEEHDHALSETLRDARVPKRKKLFDWMSNALAHVRQVWTGPVWNFGRTKVEVRIEEKGDAGETGAGGGGGGGGEEVVFSFEEDREAGEDGDPNPHVKRSEFRHPLYPQAGKYHDIPKQRAPTQHATLMENTPEAPKDEL
jgi:hypothetical protein